MNWAASPASGIDALSQAGVKRYMHHAWPTADVLAQSLVSCKPLWLRDAPLPQHACRGWCATPPGAVHHHPSDISPSAAWTQRPAWIQHYCASRCPGRSAAGPYPSHPSRACHRQALLPSCQVRPLPSVRCRQHRPHQQRCPWARHQPAPPCACCGRRGAAPPEGGAGGWAGAAAAARCRWLHMLPSSSSTCSQP